MSDDTQSQFHEPGNPDFASAKNPSWDEVEPPIVVRVASERGSETIWLPCGGEIPPGVCLAGDGWSDVATSPPETQRPGLAQIQLIAMIQQRLLQEPRFIRRLETLLEIESDDRETNMRRADAVSVALWSRPDLIENAETLLNAEA